MRPPLLKAEIDQGRAVGKVVIAACDVMGPHQQIPVRDDHEVPVLMIAGRRRLGAVPHDLGKHRVVDRGSVEVAAGPTLRENIEDPIPVRGCIRLITQGGGEV